MEEDKSDVTSWLNKAFVETMLRDNEEDSSIVVQDVVVSPAVGKGENYSSLLHRVAVNFTTVTMKEKQCFPCVYKQNAIEHQRTLIVKSVPEMEMAKKMLIEAGLFDRECGMYQEILPALYKLQEKHPDAGVAIFSTRTYRTTRQNTIVMDDLIPLGYKMADRHQGLDLQHTKLALRGFARLHALSLGLVAQDPTSMNRYAESFYVAEKREEHRYFIEPLINTLASCVDKWTGFRRFGDKLRNFVWFDLMAELIKVKEGGLAVLNHGDGWTNNMLFKYSESGEVESVKFVDFQLSRYTSPAIDLQYFMHTSASEEVRDKHWDEVMEEYYKAVVSTLKAIDCESKTFTLEKLKEELQEKMMFGLLAASVVLPLALVDSQDVPEMTDLPAGITMEDMMQEANFGKLYNVTRFREIFEKILLNFENIGII